MGLSAEGKNPCSRDVILRIFSRYANSCEKSNIKLIGPFCSPLNLFLSDDALGLEFPDDALTEVSNGVLGNHAFASRFTPPCTIIPGGAGVLTCADGNGYQI
jgi:hypothetical protein